METKAKLEKQIPGGFFLHDKVDHLPDIPVGTIIRITDNRLLAAGNPGPNAAFDDAGPDYSLYESDDNGEIWKSLQWVIDDESEIQPGGTGALLASSSGTIVIAFANLAEKHWPWDDEKRDAPGAILPTCAMRSVDRGKSWKDVQTLHTEWTGATRGMIETTDGRIVFTTMKMLHDPGRHSVMTYSSPDDGVTWQASNIIDLGGSGHHDGLTEAALVELRDGRLLKYIRTMWGRFWRAESTDGGLNWHPYGPTDIAASSAPCALRRLASGRIVMVWNRPYPQGDPGYALENLHGGDGIWSATPASNYRAELSISFSDDECESWSAPVAFAYKDREISYPQIFEHSPGELWITADRWDFRVRLFERDFV